MACEKDNSSITVNYPVTDNYTALDVSNAFDVVVCDTISEAKVTVRGGEHKNVIFKVEDGTLKIGFKNGLFHWNHGTAKVLLPYNSKLCDVELSGASNFRGNLQGDEVDVDLSGASDFYCEIDADEVNIDISGASDFFGDIWADEIDMALSGSSTIKGNVEALDLNLEMSGASDATFEGYVGTLKINLTGASNIKKTINEMRYGFECDQCEGSMSGSSDAYIHCDGTIKVNLSGSSELHFTGNGNPADSHASSGSDIIHDVLP
jgi:hypothetical protein